MRLPPITAALLTPVLVPVLAPVLALPLGGCLAKTAFDVATLPVKAGGKVIDWTTTSQAEADRNYGRRMRKEEEREGRERRAWAERCRHAPHDPGCREYTGSGRGSRASFPRSRAGGNAESRRRLTLEGSAAGSPPSRG